MTESKQPYRVLAGKHRDKEGVIYRAGDVVLLTEQEATCRINKFAKVEEPVEEPVITDDDE